jgi:hypothetical protein
MTTPRPVSTIVGGLLAVALASAKAGVAQAESDLARAVATQKKTQLEVKRYTPLASRGGGGGPLGGFGGFRR